LKRLVAISLSLACLVRSQSLDDAYTLGRLNGPAVAMGASLDQCNGIDMRTLAMDFRLGKADSYLFDIPVNEISESKGSRDIGYYSLPGLRLGLHPTDGLMADIQLHSQNLWVVSNGDDASNGFDNGVPRVWTSDVRLHFLGQGGQIGLSDRTIPFAFLYGPIVEQDQLELLADWHGTHGDTSDVRGYLGQVRYGVGSSVQGWLGLSDSAYSSDEVRAHQHMLALGADWVSRDIRAGGWWSSSDRSKDPAPDGNLFAKAANWGFHGYAGFLNGERDIGAAEVAGNWNGIFASQLGKGQLDLEDTLHYYPGDGHSAAILAGNARYGLLDPLTVGANYRFYSGSEFDQQIGLEASLSNIPLRKNGPRQVSPIEYELGILPQAGQARLVVQWRLPTSDGNTVGTYQTLQTGVMDPYSNPWANWKLGWIRPTSNQPDFSAQVVGGLTNDLLATAKASYVDYFYSAYNAEVGGVEGADVKNAWVFDLGLCYHNDRIAVMADFPFYTGTGEKFIAYSSSYEEAYVVQGQGGRFGPMRIQMAAFF
jgi:hypothetical protein